VFVARSSGWFSGTRVVRSDGFVVLGGTGKKFNGASWGQSSSINISDHAWGFHTVILDIVIYIYLKKNICCLTRITSDQRFYLSTRT
jgi:hypothetical protein